MKKAMIFLLIKHALYFSGECIISGDLLNFSLDPNEVLPLEDIYIGLILRGRQVATVSSLFNLT